MRNLSLSLIFASGCLAQTWTNQGSTSLLSNVSPAACSNTTPPSYCAGIIFDYAGNFPGVMTAWSGAVARTKVGSEQLLVFGGGHVSTLDNAVYSYNFNVSPATVSALTFPSLPNATASPATSSNVTCVSPNADGTPLSYHTYGQLGYFSQSDKMVFWEDGAGNYCATPGSRNLWIFDPTAKTWTNMMPTGVAGFDIHAGSDTTQGAFCSPDTSFALTTDETMICEWGNNNMLVRYDYTANTWAKLTNFGSQTYPEAAMSAIDPVRKIFVMLGSSLLSGGTLKFIKVDISNSSYNYTDLTSTLQGCGAFSSSTYPGIEYDPYSRNFMAYPGLGNTVYEINPDTGVCQPYTASGGPTTSVGEGTFGHWRYFPSLGKFVSVTAVGSDAFTFQMPYSGLGSSTVTCIDRDGDGYGTGPGCTGFDADDTDPAVQTATQAVTKWGSMAVFLLHLGYAPARTWYISTAGNDSACVSGGAPVGIGSPCLTFGAINSNLVAGDMVVYRAGTYATVGAAITLTVSGTIGAPIIIMAYPGETVTINESSLNGYVAQMLDQAYVTVDGIRMTSANTEDECVSGGTSNYGLSANTFHNITLRHIDAGQCGVWGIIVAGFDNFTIEDSVWHEQNVGGGQHGIYIGAKGNALSTNAFIQRNIIYDNDYTGVQVNGNVSGMTESQNISYGNIIADYSWENGIHNSFFLSNIAIGWEQSGGLVISEYDGNEGLSICGSGGTSLCVCTPTPNLGATCAHDQTGNLIQNFTAYGTSTGSDGLSAQNSPAIEVDRQGASCSTATCLAANLGGNTFRNIVAVANTDGSGNYMPIVYPDASTGWPQSSTFSDLALYNNDSTHSANVFGYGPGSSFGNHGYTCASPPSGVTLTACTNADPKFVSASPTYAPATYNFNLQSSSPALGVGTSTGLPAFDIAGNPFGASPNIGAYASTCMITPSTAGPWTVGQVPGTTFTASGCGGGTLTWTSSGLPAGLSGCNSVTGTACSLSGTLTTASSYTPTINVTDGGSNSASIIPSIVVNAAPSITTSSPLPAGTVGTAYSQTLAATGGTTPLTWSVSSGTVPTGTSLASSGVLSGTPSTTVGNPFSFVALVTDANSITASKTFSVTINPGVTATPASSVSSGVTGSGHQPRR